ncbi:tRNA1(Val) (adenine(37)-N6)-methyltransferase [Chryseobacterium sp.]|uniref:tRNA1(Val) (adenine(37)-N6)-methyltransferase n=1 Tax=Chryseobacterium sp. TaxID=1871047 RepID=UPI0011CC3C87|nr:methyltransferase [Chryseobacterium sp.]TXF77236.1 methyltransferase [Chryseobacterium sp.]
MKAFQFKNFSVLQQEEVFKIGTDGVLLGAMSSVGAGQRILEIGTGSGLISLMAAQRNVQAFITAIDINPDAAELAAQNFKNSPFHERMECLQADFKNFESEEKFDLILCNPPYFEENPSVKHVLARQQTELDFRSLIIRSTLLLSPSGIFSVIIPFESGNVFEELTRENQLHLIKKINISGIAGSKPKRLVMEFCFTEKPLVEGHFTIEKSPRKYSDQYLELTKEFHVFKK